MSYKYYSAKEFLLPIIAAAAIWYSGVSHASLVSYSETFDSLIATSSSALSDAGFVIYSNTYSDQGLSNLLGSAGPAPARNDYRAFAQVVSGHGGSAQGSQQLFVYSNYLSRDQRGSYVDALTLQQQTIGGSDLGSTWTFGFDAMQGDITGTSSASAWIRAVEGENVLGESLFDTTKLGFDWGSYAVSLYIDPSWEGMTLEFGVKSAATGYTMSGVYYDNFSLTGDGAGLPGTPPVPVPAAVWLFSSGLLGLIGIARRNKRDE